MDTVTGIKEIEYKNGNSYERGKMLTFKDGETPKDDRIFYNGERYYRHTIKERDENGKIVEKSIYLCGGRNSKEKFVPDKIKSDKEKYNSSIECFNKYDRAVDELFDGFEKNIMGIDKNKTCTDKDDNGDIGGLEATKHIVRGAVVNPVKSMIKHPLITGAAILGGALLCFFCPPAGAALLYTGLALGTVTAGVGTYQMATAKTDAQSRNAWENIGSGVTTAILSAIGIKNMHNTQAAKMSTDTIQAAKAAKLANATRQDAIAQIDAVKSLVAKGDITGEGARALIAEILQNYHAADSTAKVSAQATAAIAKLAPQTTAGLTTTVAETTTKASALAEGRELASEALHHRLETLAKPVKALGEYTHPIRDTKDAIQLTSQDSPWQLVHNGIRKSRILTPKSGFKTQGLQYVKDLCAEATKLVSEGKPLEAKEAMILVSKTLKAGTFGDGELAAAKALAKATSQLVSATTFMPKSLGLMGSTYVGAMLNTDMADADDLVTKYAILAD